ncbi:MAG TPA: hypothetical protein VIL65_07975 [Beijerinckiaceae bacterium]|jgi:hypothetical protein
MHAQLRDTTRYLGLVRAAQLAGEAMAYAPDDESAAGSVERLRAFALLAVPLLAVAGAVAWIAV